MSAALYASIRPTDRWSSSCFNGRRTVTLVLGILSILQPKSRSNTAIDGSETLALFFRRQAPEIFDG
jgi:hypothetical protein